MLDMSMEETDRGPIVHTLSGGARAAAVELKPGDRVALASFSTIAKTILRLTGDAREFESALRKTGTWVVQRSGRHLYDSLLTALNLFPEAAQSERRRCIVVLTTASDAGSRHTVDDVVLAAGSKSVAVFVAFISPHPSQTHITLGTVHRMGANVNESEEKKALEPLARRTGGELRVYEESQYAIAAAIRDTVNRPERSGSAPDETRMGSQSLTAEKTRLVRLDVQVIDAQTGEIPELLGRQDFNVRADGQRIPIRNVEIEMPPMDLVFLIYLSNPGLSTPLDRRRYAQGLKAVVTALRPEDRARVIRGSGASGVSLPLTCDPVAIGEALLRGKQPDKNRLFDAAASALSLLLAGQTSFARRRAIVAITDDIERHSETKEDALKEDLLRAGVTLHEVIVALAPAGPRVLGGSAGPIHLPGISGIPLGRDLAARGSLVGVVHATGGEGLIGDAFDASLPALIRRMRMRYTLTVAVPAAAAAFHTIEVGLTPESRLAHPNITVRARIAYYSEP